MRAPGWLVKTILRIVVFVVTFWALTIPSWRLAERLWARDVSSAELPPHLFPVLARSPDVAGRFTIGFYPDLAPQSKLVTEVGDSDVDRINQDLRARIGATNSSYEYFKILGRGNGYTDVSLEVPTTRDFWPKSWYRLQGGEVHPQRLIFFGPSLSMLVAFVPGVAGVLAILGCNRFLARRRMQSTEERRLARPPLC